ncbi:MAG: lipid-A-disaccharide synthase [Chlamydiae bacterium]|nr:lipid-A-disaccharide synthase [Chlamydiota bacterium]
MIFLSAGEKSGDLLGSKIIKALQQHDPQVEIAAVAGPLMRQSTITVVEETESFEVMGIIDVLSNSVSLLKLFLKIREAILRLRPQIVILIDYAEYHLLLAKSLRKAGFKGKIAQVVCPSVWAWRKGRIRSLESHFDYLFCLFPFEPSYFSHTKLEVFYVGHPLTEQIPPPKGRREKILSLFPGSRKGEIKRNLPLQLKAAKEFIKEHPEFKIAVSLARPEVEKICKKEGIKAQYFAPKDNCQLMKKSALSIAKSGTINLELALHQVPTVVTYVMSKLDYFLAKYIFKIALPHLCIVNILLNKKVFPEHYGIHLCAKKICEDLKNLPNPTMELRDILKEKKSAEEIVAILFSSPL